MGGGSLAHRNPLSCLVNHSNHWRSHCHPRLPTAAWHNHHKSRLPRSFTRLRVAQQFDTLTDVNSKPAEAQQELLQDQLQAAVEEAVPVEVPPDVLTEFEQVLEEDLASVSVTLAAVTGVIIFWRGVWSLLDYMLGDSIYGDICCIIVGLTIVLGIRLSGFKVSSNFWPNS